MKKSCLLAALAASVMWMGLAADPATAQQQPVRPQGLSGVALLDVNYVFKKHARFKSQMEEMRGDVERSQTEWKRQNEGINKLVERLNEFRPGTPDYKAMEEEIVNQRTKLQATMTIAKKDFLQREAKVYYNVYQEIMQEVKYYCEANGVTLVMTFNGDKINPENPEDVLRGINQKVVYYNPEMDITPLILKRLGAAAPQINPGPAMQTRPGVYVPQTR